MLKKKKNLVGLHEYETHSLSNRHSIFFPSFKLAVTFRKVFH